MSRSCINIGGNTTVGQNIGTGIDIYAGKSGVNALQFKSLSVTGSTMAITCDGDNIYFSAQTGGGGGTITGGANGLCTSGENIVLGGSLSGNTTIDLNGKNLTFDNTSSNFSVTGDTVQSYAHFANYICGKTILSMASEVQAAMGVICDGNTSCQTSLVLNLFENYILDEIHSSGISYNADYSAIGALNPRWIPDAAWVTGQTGGVSCCIGWTCAGNSNGVSVGCNAYPYAAGSFLNNENNVAVGVCALSANTTGSWNTAIGYESLVANTTGSENVSIGPYAMYQHICGTQNVAIGSQAMDSLISGTTNVALGWYALGGATGGDYNIALGGYTMGSMTTGECNVAAGYDTLNEMIDGCYNTALGGQAMAGATHGSWNIGIGYQALASNEGNCNVAVGLYAGSANDSQYSVFLGADAGRSTNYSDKSVFIGYCAGYDESLSNKLHIANCALCSLIEGNFTGKTVTIDSKLITTNFQMTSGAANGCVLTSDASGNASWATGGGGGGLSATNNGLCDNGTTAGLGGTLANNTEIAGGGNSLSFPNLGGMAITGTSFFAFRLCSTSGNACSIQLDAQSSTVKLIGCDGTYLDVGQNGVTMDDSSGSYRICNLPAKSTETDVIYVDGNGAIFCGAAGGGASYWSSGATGLYPTNGEDVSMDNDTAICWVDSGAVVCAVSGVTSCQLSFNTGGACFYLRSNGWSRLTSSLFSVVDGVNQINIYAGATNTIAPSLGQMLMIQGGNCSSGTGSAKCLCLKGGFHSDNGLGGNVLIDGGVSCCADGGDIILRGGTTTCLATVTGDIYLCGLPSKNAETCVVWIASDGQLSTATPTSDCRLKCCVQPITSAVSLLENICGYSAEYNNLSNCEGCCEYVLIAQEIENDLPLAVKNGVIINDIDYKKIEYDQLVPVLWNIVKEQEVRIKALEDQLS